MVFVYSIGGLIKFLANPYYKQLGYTYLILCCAGPTDPLFQVSTNNENHVHALISDIASILFLFGEL